MIFHLFWHKIGFLVWSRLFSKILSRPLWHLCTCRPHLECRAVANTCSALVSWQLSCHLQSLYMESARSPPPPSKLVLQTILLIISTSVLYFLFYNLIKFLISLFYVFFNNCVLAYYLCHNTIQLIHFIVFTIIIILSILLLLYLLSTIHNDYLYIKKE